MNFQRRGALLLVLLIVFGATASCTVLESLQPTESPVLENQTPAAGTPAAETPLPSEGTPSAEATPEETINSGPVTLRIWLPPQFIPDPNSEAGALLDSRLSEFELLHPGIRITVRMKAETGPGGIVSSLSATRNAVPEALPDLVLIPRTEMERAARSQLLLPFIEPLEADWYDFARSLATINQSVYGIPFATDALVLLYRPEVILDPPKDWTTTINSNTPILFAGGAKDALFTFALYSAAGGKLMDENQRPFIDEATLKALLTFYQDAQVAGVLAEQTNQITNENVVYQSFQNQETDMAVTWVSNSFKNSDEFAAASGLPTVSSKPYTLATGWLWAVSNPDPARQSLATGLANFLTTPEFLSAWTAASGYLPPRAEALNLWADSPEASLASRVVLSANPLPPIDVIEKAGPELQQAILDVLGGDVSPAEAAQKAVGKINSP
jgi:ABC-type glycerol-3-phosphate transport system substrate-binding protein